MACIVEDSNRRWDGPIVPFTIDANLTNPQRVMQAIAAWESVTGVRFVARDSQHDYVHVQHGQHACHSDLGRRGGKQFTTLQPGCGVAAIIHELGHTLGLQHEHQRPDRDGFVTVHLNNVEKGEESDFKKLSASDVITTPNYDFQSIMHYDSTTFSNNPSDNTVHTIDGNNGELLDSSTSPTPFDVQLVSESYRSFVGVVRRSDSGINAAGATGEIAVASIFPNFITAVQTGAGTLKLILWNMDSVGGITRVSDSGDQAGEASHIAIAGGGQIAGGGTGIVTAVRTGSGKLKLISWELTFDNQIKRIDDGFVEPGPASVIQILNLSPSLAPSLFLTAHSKGSPGRLQLITWRLNLDGSFTRLNENHDAGEVAEISLTLHQPPRSDVPTALVATTVRTGSGNTKVAKVIAWQIALADGSITRGGDRDIGKATQLASAVQSVSALDPTEHLVVSLRNAGGVGDDLGRLTVITFVVSETGDNVDRVDDSGKQAGGINGNALVARLNGVLSAVGTTAGNLKLINWRVDVDGSITRTGDSSSQAGEVGAIVLGTSSHPSAPLVTAVERGDGDLALISWDDNPAHGEI